MRYLGGILLCAILMFPAMSLAGEKTEKWEGVDKAVVEKIAKGQGREASEPFINTEQGDLMLFLFLTAGAVGGFIAGYSYRALTERNAVAPEKAS